MNHRHHYCFSRSGDISLTSLKKPLSAAHPAPHSPAQSPTEPAKVEPVPAQRSAGRRFRCGQDRADRKPPPSALGHGIDLGVTPGACRRTGHRCGRLPSALGEEVSGMPSCSSHGLAPALKNGTLGTEARAHPRTLHRLRYRPRCQQCRGRSPSPTARISPSGAWSKPSSGSRNLL